jgi:hypothetical protein
MRLVVESVCAENICAYAQDSSEQHSFSPPGGIQLLAPFFRTALYASLLARLLRNLEGRARLRLPLRKGEGFTPRAAWLWPFRAAAITPSARMGEAE